MGGEGDVRFDGGRARLGAWLALTALLVLGSLLLLQPGVRVEATAQRAASGATLDTPAEQQRALELASDGLPIKPHAASAEQPEGPMHPHPITKAHERIFRENALVASLNLAVDLKDPVKLREVLAEYRAEYPEDDHRLQGGYAILADCLTQLDEATRERARHFWQTEIRSQTRRYVRRHCLER